MRLLCQFAGPGVLGVLLLAGCASRPGEVPMSAQLMTQGQQNISFRPTEYGRVYVTDRDSSRILYQADIHRGEIVELDAPANRIRVDGHTVTEQPLDDHHQYRIYFEPLPSERTASWRDRP